MATFFPISLLDRQYDQISLYVSGWVPVKHYSSGSITYVPLRRGRTPCVFVPLLVLWLRFRILVSLFICKKVSDSESDVWNYAISCYHSNELWSNAWTCHVAGYEWANSLLKSTIFWEITPCSLLKVNRRFEGTYRFHLQGRRISRARIQHESRWQAELSGNLPKKSYVACILTKIVVSKRLVRDMMYNNWSMEELTTETFARHRKCQISRWIFNQNFTSIIWVSAHLTT
jgi:hypothetical protein